MAGPLRRQGIMEQRRENVRRVDAMTVKVTRVSGRILVVGVGEAAVDVPFPVAFAERPNFTFGGELDENHRAVAESYPTVSAVVVNWDKEGEGPGRDGRYVGATLAAVTTGPDGQAMWIHYAFEGKAIRNPINEVGSLDDVI